MRVSSHRVECGIPCFTGVNLLICWQKKGEPNWLTPTQIVATVVAGWLMNSKNLCSRPQSKVKFSKTTLEADCPNVNGRNVWCWLYHCNWQLPSRQHSHCCFLSHNFFLRAWTILRYPTHPFCICFEFNLSLAPINHLSWLHLTCLRMEWNEFTRCQWNS